MKYALAIALFAAVLAATPAAAQQWSDTSVDEVEALLETDPAAGRQLAEALSRTGVPDAINLYATVIEEQAESTEDYAAAVVVYEQAVAAGSNKARVNLAYMLIFHPDHRDYARSISLAQQAAGDPDTAAFANYLLGQGYLFGNGVKQDVARGVGLLQKSIEKEPDNSDAQYLVGRAYSDGWSVEQDFERAWHHQQIAAGFDHPQALFEVALFLREGEVVPQDHVKSHQYGLRSAEAGYVKGQILTAVTYALGEGVAVNGPEARIWYGRAMEQGSAHALRGLGSMLMTGEGGPVDHLLGTAYLELATEGEDEYAPSLIDRHLSIIDAQDRSAVDAAKKAWRARYGEPWSD